MKVWECPRCKKATSGDKQFCQHCLFNVGYYYSSYKFTTIGTDGAAQKRDWDRIEYAHDTVQPWRQGKPSKEFIKLYPERAKKTFTEKEMRKAKDTWRDVKGLRDVQETR